MKNALYPLAKSVSLPLVLTAAASPVDEGIHKKHGWQQKKSGMTTLIISNEELDDIILDC